MKPTSSRETANISDDSASLSDDIQSPAIPLEPIPYWILPSIAVVIATILGIMLMPDWSEEWYRYQSVRQAHLANREGANEYLKKLMESKPQMSLTDPTNPANNPTFLAESGYNCVVMGKYDEAIEWYTKAQALGANMGTDDQNNPRPAVDFSSQLGGAYYLKGNKEEARKHTEAALAKYRLNMEANYYMGLLEYDAKNLQKATEYLKVVAQDVRYKDKVKEIYARIEADLFADIK